MSIMLTTCAMLVVEEDLLQEEVNRIEHKT